jgi:hypothetical protein
MANIENLPELLTCGCCFADIQTISASLYHVGYTAFNCGGGSPNTDTKYLQFKKQGIGTVTACGGFSANKKNLTQTWTVDPFTNTTCYNGDTGTISYLCGEAEISNCTATQKTYNCGSATEQEKTDFCIEGDFQKSLTESLEDEYTLDDVSDNVDSALSAVGFSNPKASFGTVNFGTGGNKVLAWSANSGTPESRFTYLLNNQGVRDGVYKQKARVKFLRDGALTKITELENGTITKETIEVTKDQIITLNPPDEPGKIYFIPYCSTKYIDTNVKTSCSGTLTTKTNNNQNCTFFTGPDCELYNTKTTTIQYKRNSNYNFDGGDLGTFVTSSSETNANWIFTDTACPATSTVGGSNVYKETGTERCIGASLGADPCYSDSIDNTVTATPKGITCSYEPDPFFCKWGADEELYRGPLYGYSCDNCEKNITKTEWNGVYNFTSTPSIEGSVIICTYSESANYDSPGEFISGGEGKTFDLVDNFELNGTKITTFSNTELDSKNSNIKTETCVLGANNCQSCNNCASWYVTHNQDIKRTATVSIEASFTALEVGKNNQGNPNPPKNYITFVQTVRRKNDTSNPECLNIQLTQNVSTYNNTSSGGNVKITVPSITLNSEKDTSDCLTHVSAVTFEVI